jgi:hypothetical protein
MQTVLPHKSCQLNPLLVRLQHPIVHNCPLNAHYVPLGINYLHLN